MGKSKDCAFKMEQIVGEMLFKFKRCYIVKCSVNGKKKLRTISKRKVEPKKLIVKYKSEKARFARVKARAREKENRRNNQDDDVTSISRPSQQLEADQVETPTAPTGLIYFQNNCFVSSVLQMLYTITPLRMAVENFKNEDGKEEIVSSLGNMFRKMSGGPSTSVKFFVSTLLQKPGFMQFGEVKRRGIACNQSDTHEFFLQISDAIKESVIVGSKSDSKNSVVFQQMYCQSVYERITLQNENTFSQTDEMPFIQSVVGHHAPDLYSGITADNTGETDKKKYKESIKKFTRLPSYITVQLKRFSFNKVTNKSRKLFEKQDFPMKLDLERFCLPSLQNKIKEAREKRIVGSYEDDPGSNAAALYQLTAVISHAGASLSSGHYISWVKRKLGNEIVWYKCNNERVTQVTPTEVLSLAEENDENGIAYLLLYGPGDDFHRKRTPIQKSENVQISNVEKKKPAAPKRQRVTRSSTKLEPTAKLVFESDGELTDSEEIMDEPQFGELCNGDGELTCLVQRSHLWDMQPSYPLTANKLSVWKVGGKTTCSFLVEEHWKTDFPALGTEEWTTARNLLMTKLEAMNMGKSINHKKVTKNADWKCRQCCVFFGSYDGFLLHLKCHHFPSSLMNDDEKQAAVICIDTLKSVEKREKYFNPVAVWRCQFLFDCFQEKVIDKNFNVIKEAEVGNVFHTFAKKRGLRVPEIAQLKSTLLFPELNHAVWDVYRVKNWKLSKGSEPLSESDLKIASDTTFHFINQMKELARTRGKIYAFLLVPVDVAAVIQTDHDGDATKFLAEYSGNIIKEPLVVIVGKCSSSSLNSIYHFLSQAENSSYTKNLLETGKYTPFRISSVPFKTDSSADYQQALAEKELAQILYVKMCISYTTAVQKNSKLHFVDHQKVEGHVLQKMLQKDPKFLHNTMEAVVMSNGEIFNNQNMVELDSLQISLSNPAELSLEEIKFKKGRKSTCLHCGYVAGSRNDQLLHQLLHSQSLPESSSVDRIFSFPWNFSDKKHQDSFLKNMLSWKHRQQNEKPEFYCYLLALDKKNERNEHKVFQRLEKFLSDMEFRKANPDMFWFYAGKNAQNEGPSKHHLNGLSGVARTGRNSYTIKTWTFENLQKQMEFEASLLLFAEKSQEYQANAVHFVNQRLEFTAFENPLSLDKIRQIYHNVNDGQEVFSFANNTTQQKNQLYFDNQLDEATFCLHLHGSYKKKPSKKEPAVEKPENEKRRGKSGIRFPFHCKACGVGFTWYHLLARHYSTCQLFKLKYPDEAATFMPRGDESRKSINCSICKQQFGSSTIAKEHFLNVHLNLKKYRCAEPTCWRKFFHKVRLERHERTHNGDKPYKCSFCEKPFSRSDVLIEHIRIHTGEKPYICRYCSKEFAQKSTLTSHVYTHTGNKPFKCRYCKTGFTQQSPLTRHERIHTGKKPYKCNFCAKGFSRQDHLTRHEKSHTGDKPYKCIFCEKGFLRHDHLIEHIRIHTGEKPYMCHYCSNEFAQQSQLTRHERIHTGDKPYKCRLCVYRTARKDLLRKHERVNHDESDSI